MSYNKFTGLYEGYVYCITNLINTKKYIGVTTTTVNHRKTQHFSKHNSKSNNKQIIKIAIEKYEKENFKVEQLMKVVANDKKTLKKKLSQEEKFCIKWFKSLVNEHGYNVEKGGYDSNKEGIKVNSYTLDGELLMSFDSYNEASFYYSIAPDVISNMCKGRSQKTSENYGITFRHSCDNFNDIKPYRYKRSKYVYQYDEDRNFIREHSSLTDSGKSIGLKCGTGISIAIKSKTLYYGYYWSFKKYDILPHTEINKRNKIKVDQYDLNGNFIKTHNSISEAILYIGKTLDYVSSICACCEGKKNFVFNYVWRYKGDSFNKFDIKIKNTKVQVDQYSLYGDFIGSFKTIQEALNYNSIDSDYNSQISQCCKGKKAYVQGFVWRFKGDPFNKYRTIDKHCKPLNCYSLDDKFIKTYISSNDVAEKLNCNAANISACAKGKTRTSNGYKWFYADDISQPDKTKIFDLNKITYKDML